MTKKTTSDELKAVLGGEEKDWKRLSKKKNDAGQWVREFENKKTGDHMEVVEMGAGKFLARSLTSEANQNFAKEEDCSPIETDPVRNAAAEEALKIIMGEATEDYSDDAEGGVPKQLLDKAGKALANRFCFAICSEGDYGYLTAMITPIRYFKENGYCVDYSNPIDHLLPGCAEITEATYEFSDPTIKTATDAAEFLTKQGFIWNRDFQEFVERNGEQEQSVMKELDAWAQKAAKSASKAKPRPKI